MKFGIEKCIRGIKKKKKGKRERKEIIEISNPEISSKLGEKRSTCVYWKYTPSTKEK